MDLVVVHYLNVFLGTGVIILQILIVSVLSVLFFNLKKNKLLDFIKKYLLIIGFLVSFLATLFSLIYSEIIGFPPCRLCWFQRIFIYPQVFLFGVALWNRYQNKILNEAKSVIQYSFPLLLVGFFVSIYHNFIYYFRVESNLPCDASGISCYKQMVSEFGGYISIPMLSLTTFFVLLTLIFVGYFYEKE